MNETERKDFYVGLILQGLSFPALIVSIWLWLPFQAIGFQLSMGTIRDFYNKYFWSKIYWYKQRRLWKNSE